MMDAIYDEIKAERERQDQKWGGPEHDGEHDHYLWIQLIHSRAMMAEDGCSSYYAAPDYRRRMVQVAALAVAALQAYDRERDQERLLSRGQQS